MLPKRKDIAFPKKRDGKEENKMVQRQRTAKPKVYILGSDNAGFGPLDLDCIHATLDKSRLSEMLRSVQSESVILTDEEERREREEQCRHEQQRLTEVLTSDEVPNDGYWYDLSCDGGLCLYVIELE